MGDKGPAKGPDRSEAYELQFERPAIIIIAEPELVLTARFRPNTLPATQTLNYNLEPSEVALGTMWDSRSPRVNFR